MDPASRTDFVTLEEAQDQHEDLNILPLFSRPHTRTPERSNTFFPNYLVSLLHDGYSKEYYKGNVYETIKTKYAQVWEDDTADLPYLNRIRRAAKAFPDLEYLASWMEVSTTPSRWQYISDHPDERSERAKRTRVCVIDYESEEGRRVDQIHSSSTAELREALAPQAKNSARLIVVEDLSRDVIELLGTRYNIDPHFFRSHINDFLWYGTTEPFVERPQLDVVARRRSHFRLQYLRPRYFRNRISFGNAMGEAGWFNVLRRPDSDRTHQTITDGTGGIVTLARSKASLWTRPNGLKEEGAVGILLVDPTVSEGHPLWGGYSSFESWSDATADDNMPIPPRKSLYEDVIYWSGRMSSAKDLSNFLEEPKTLGFQMLSLIISDWQFLIHYITARLGQVEWEIELPALRREASGVDASLKKLHPWRRNVPLYRAMIANALDDIFSKKEQRDLQESNAPDHGLAALMRDFEMVLRDMDEIQARIERIVSVATALLSIEDGRRAMEQNKNVTRLTYLATIFIPLSFMTGFFSMAPDLSDLTQTIWIYFAVAIPLTAIAMLVADFWHIQHELNLFLSRFKKKKTE